MNRFAPKKVLVFGLLGALGCLIGWAAGEGLLATGLPARVSKTGRAPSLATRPEAPEKIDRTGELISPVPKAPAIPQRDPSVPAVSPPYPVTPTLAKREPPPPLPPEYETRAKKAGAKSGQLQFTLIWYNRNDLDLHCIDPFGVEIFYSRKRSDKSGGHLDVDRNVTGETTEPVENIYFPEGKAPLGRYRVLVRHYKNHGDPDPTEYKANLLIEDRRLNFSGRLTFDDKQSRQLIHEFYLTGLRITAPSEIVLYPGGKNRFWVRLGRERNQEPVRLLLAGDTAGLKFPDSVFMAGNRDETEIEIAAVPGAMIGSRVLRLIADGKYGKVETETRIAVQEPPPGLQLGIPGEVTLFAGGRNSVRVRLERDRPDEPVRLTFAGMKAGLRLPAEVVVPAHQNEVAFDVSADRSAVAGTRTIRLSGEWKHGSADADCTFVVKTPPPVLHLAAPKEIAVFNGGVNRLPVRIAREHFAGPVRIRAGDGNGLTLGNLVIPDDREEGEIEVSAASYTKEGQHKVALLATSNGTQAIASLVVNVSPMPPPPESATNWSWRLIVLIGMWTAFLAIGLSLALMIGQNRYLGRPCLSAREAGIAIAGGGLAGLVSGGIGQALLALLSGSNIFPQFGFLAGWLLLGGLLGRGVGFFIPNLHARRSLLAGMVGGLIGSLAFIVVSKLGDLPGRLAGATLLGFCIGMMVVLVEGVFRKAWLEVRYGTRETISVNLGAEPIRVGGDGKVCTIWARGAAPVAYRIWLQSGRVLCEDIERACTEELSEGMSRQAGNIELFVRTETVEPEFATRGQAAPAKEIMATVSRTIRGPVPPPPPPTAIGNTRTTKAALPPPPAARMVCCPQCGRKCSASTRTCEECGNTL